MEIRFGDWSDCEGWVKEGGDRMRQSWKEKDGEKENGDSIKTWAHSQGYAASNFMYVHSHLRTQLISDIMLLGIKLWNGHRTRVRKISLTS